MIEIEIDKERCSGCGLCLDFCPVSVFDLSEAEGRRIASAARCGDCWACDTCVGQCPERAITIIERADQEEYEDTSANAPCSLLHPDEKARYAVLSKEMEKVLSLRWKPVAVTLIPCGTALPPVPVPRVKLRYCQSIMLARRGKSLLMPPHAHACPDGSHVLGLTRLLPKLGSGELYLKFGKLSSLEAARRMIDERPMLPEKSVKATLVAPLEGAVMKPDIVVIAAPPEAMMWLCMASSFYTGRAFNFRISTYNAQCVETTVYPHTTGEINISLGCYGSRASSDIGDDMMFMGIPIDRLPQLVDGLKELGEKAIPDARSKIYLPPMV